MVVVIEWVFMKNSDSGILCEVRRDERPVKVQVEREKTRLLSHRSVVLLICL
jgi:hypothetical protein